MNYKNNKSAPVLKSKHVKKQIWIFKYMLGILLKEPQVIELKLKLEAPRSLYSSPGYNNNISQ